jgi:Spy/CpxP family protein refolding chaperone
MTEPTVRQKASLWLAIVFVLGAALGGILGYAFAHRSYASESTNLTAEAKRTQRREQMAREVGLSAEQQARIKEIFDHAQTEYKSIHEVMDPQIESVRQKTRDKIREQLTPDQKPKFEEFLRKMDEERKRVGQ